MGGCGGASVRIGTTRIRGVCETQPFHRSGRRRSNSAPIGSGSGEHAEPALVHDDTTKEPGSSEMNSNGHGGIWQGGNGGGGRRRRIAQHGRSRLRAMPRRAAPAKRSYMRDREPSIKRDYHTRRGAEKLARQIENYWRSLGFNVRTWLVPFESAAPDPLSRKTRKSGCRGALWLVRSSLANGLPPGRDNPFHGSIIQAVRRSRGDGGNQCRSQFVGDAVPFQPPAAEATASGVPKGPVGGAGYPSPPTADTASHHGDTPERPLRCQENEIAL